MLPDKVAFAFPIHPRQMNCALALDEANHLRHRVLRRYRNHHVHVVRHQMPFHYLALFLSSKLAEYFSEMLAQLSVQCPAPTLWNEYHVIFAVPRRVAQTFKLVHLVSSSHVLGGSRLEVSTMDNSEYVKLLLPPRQSRGNSFGCRAIRNR
ncbi:hypothetical protein PROAA_130025 [Candidatus Propionivibrio aalborgensis]|uniref:Uncharacterized protein n=1 Tax=Candidatus Propionivibrio aalborgensis TaxID=1860101 RepID=A0A1A8XJE1_9RHOO|nr:hypothetical protein PROAA_130025 [Candidatus Propionivibrio aalborgensis]